MPQLFCLCLQRLLGLRGLVSIRIRRPSAGPETTWQRVATGRIYRSAPCWARPGDAVARPVQRPLYPRYLFLPLDHRTTSWTPIRDTPGVVGLVRSGTAVHYARAGDVERLQATEAQRARPPAPDTPWRVGDACRLAHGAFSGQVGVVRMVVGELARLQLMMLGGLRDVVVNVDALAPRDE